MPEGWLGRITLATASTTELVRALAHPNIWWRRHAQRLLLDRKPEGIAGPLASAAVSADPAAGRAHALWTADGLGILADDTLRRALRDPAAGVRENAIRIAGLRPGALACARGADLLGLANDTDPKVRFQLLLTIGDLDTPRARAARTALLFDNLDDEWMQVAGLSGRSWNPVALLRSAVMRLGIPRPPARAPCSPGSGR